MNRNIKSALAVSAVAAAAIGAAMLSPRSAWAAGDITVDPAPFVGAATRADVRRALFKGPPLLRGDALWDEPPRASSQLTSAAARDEYKVARDLVRGMTGEDSGSAYMKAHPQPRSPTAVMGGPAAADVPMQVEPN